MSCGVERRQAQWPERGSAWASRWPSARSPERVPSRTGIPDARSRVASGWSIADDRLVRTTTGFEVWRDQPWRGLGEGVVAVVLRHQVDGQGDHVDRLRRPPARSGSRRRGPLPRVRSPTRRAGWPGRAPGRAAPPAARSSSPTRARTARPAGQRRRRPAPVRRRSRARLRSRPRGVGPADRSRTSPGCRRARPGPSNGVRRTPRTAPPSRHPSRPARPSAHRRGSGRRPTCRRSGRSPGSSRSAATASPSRSRGASRIVSSTRPTTRVSSIDNA